MAYDLQIISPRRRRGRQGRHAGSATEQPGANLLAIPPQPVRGNAVAVSTWSGMLQIGSEEQYPPGQVLFVEGQATSGVFLITRGRLKLSTGSVNGNSIILRMAEAGDLVGLPGALNGRPYEATAEVIEPLAAVFIPRLRFLRFLRVQPDASLQVAQVLSELCHVSFQAVRRLVSTRSAPARFASFLLDLAQGAGSGGKLQAKLTLTHGQIGETLGLSRETVTRLATDFKRKGWIAVEGATLQIADAVSLQRLVEQETAASPGV